MPTACEDLGDPDESLLERLLAWQEARADGRTLPVEALCPDDLAGQAQLRAWIAAVHGFDAFAGDGANQATTPPQSITCSVNLDILRFHASGGLGEVYVARDQGLNRDVALKRIKAGADRPTSRSRFLLEAEVTGGLEHPGIVPVYGVGHDSDGRPYYAMRFIRGDSFKDAIDHFHRADGQPGRDPGERALALRQLLRRFVDVCNAVAYAHSRDILHRDLKPANVMLGPYGETLVVDWGLAKVLGRADGAGPVAEAALHPSSGSGHTPTRAGSALGTPAFMSPEQAGGRLEELGPASDVYSLGAMLYNLLAGRPPFVDAERGDLLKKVQAGEFRPPRQVNRTVPPALDAVCLKAMAKEPGGRYPSPEALADEIEHWLADEPVAAWREPFSIRARRWMQRHKPLVAAAVAVLITAVAVLAASTVVVSRKQAETDEARRLAASNFRKARDAVERMLTRVGGDLLNRSLNDVEQVRRDLLEDALEFQQEFLHQRPTDPQVRHDVARARLRAADIRLWLGKPREAEADYHKAIAELERLAAEFPAEPSHRIELAKGFSGLGFLHWSDGRLQDSGEACRRALDLQRVVAMDDPACRPDLARYLNSLATVFLGSGRAEDLARAEELLREAEGLNSQLVAETPKEPKPRRELVSVLGNLSLLRKNAGDLSDAEAICRRALDVQASLVNDDPGKPIHARWLAMLHNKLGSILQAVGRRDDAEREYHSGLKFLEKLADDFPTAPAYRFELSSMLANLARVVATVPARADEAHGLLQRAGTPDPTG